ncbi:MAG: aspartate aminotransferase family protein [Zhenhengia sp.]
MFSQLEKQYMMPTYERFNLVLEKGEGCYVYDEEGHKYLDMGSGIAVNSLGYHHPVLTEALKNQVGKLIHTSNYYYTKPQIEAAQLLVTYSSLDKVFFCNSGTEANEGAIKLARKYGKQKSPLKTQIISLKGGFHGRTLGALSATPKEQYQKDFKPLMPDFYYAQFNDIEDIKACINENTCAVILEVIQGEGGIILADEVYLKEIEKLCAQYDALFIIDEVQTGIGRTGSLFAYAQFGLQPDIVTTAKGLGAGLPIGAILCTEKANVFAPGNHGTTFGGNLLATTAASVVLKELCENGLMEHVQSVSKYLKDRLLKMQAKSEKIVEVRGMGLMIGIEIKEPVKPLLEKCMAKGLLAIGAGEKVIRLLPPLIITAKQVDEGIAILEELLI